MISDILAIAVFSTYCLHFLYFVEQMKGNRESMMAMESQSDEIRRLKLQLEEAYNIIDELDFELEGVSWFCCTFECVFQPLDL